MKEIPRTSYTYYKRHSTRYRAGQSVKKKGQRTQVLCPFVVGAIQARDAHRIFGV